MSWNERGIGRRRRLPEVERGHDHAALGQRLVDHLVGQAVRAAPGAAVQLDHDRERARALRPVEARQMRRAAVTEVLDVLDLEYGFPYAYSVWVPDYFDYQNPGPAYYGYGGAPQQPANVYFDPNAGWGSGLATTDHHQSIFFRTGSWAGSDYPPAPLKMLRRPQSTIQGLRGRAIRLPLAELYLIAYKNHEIYAALLAYSGGRPHAALCDDGEHPQPGVHRPHRHPVYEVVEPGSPGSIFHRGSIRLGRKGASPSRKSYDGRASARSTVQFRKYGFAVRLATQEFR